MKLRMRSYGSLNNMLYDATKALSPEVGMGATLLMWTDRRAFSISRVHKNGKRFWMREDTATRTDKNGMSEIQSYSYTPNLSAREIMVTYRKDGRWKVSESQDFGGSTVKVGVRHAYHDYSF